MAEDVLTAAAVYVSWHTFKNAIESLAQGVPNQIDRSTFPGLSGGVQSQLLAGLKFLGLTKDDGRPTESLHALAVADEAARKEQLKKILQERYADLFALDLVKTTPNQLNERMSSIYNVTGDTRGKAVRFFLSAVGYAGIQVSRLFGSMATSNGARPKRRASAKPRTNAVINEEEDDLPPATKGPARTVNLKSGGSLTMSATVDFFSLSQDDRTFVFALIDQMDKYEKGNSELKTYV
ncbi:MAG: DUF5343 domain-containing protein [Betaproteobacteria bacterium]|jgi:hypothetical protein